MGQCAPRFSAKRLKEARNRTNSTQAELAKTVGVSLSAYKRWEAGKSEPGLTSAGRLAVATGLPMVWFIGIEDIRFETLTPEERDFITAYRKADANTRKLMRAYLVDALQVAKAMTKDCGQPKAHCKPS